MEADGDVTYVDEDVDSNGRGVEWGECWLREAGVLQVFLLRSVIADQFRDESSFALLQAQAVLRVDVVSGRWLWRWRLP